MKRRRQFSGYLNGSVLSPVVCPLSKLSLSTMGSLISTSHDPREDGLTNGSLERFESDLPWCTGVHVGVSNLELSRGMRVVDK